MSVPLMKCLDLSAVDSPIHAKMNGCDERRRLVDLRIPYPSFFCGSLLKTRFRDVSLINHKTRRGNFGCRDFVPQSQESEIISGLEANPDTAYVRINRLFL